MAQDPIYGKPQGFPRGPFLFSGSLLTTLLNRVLQGGLNREDSITAHAGGTQAAAYQLKRSLNRVTVVGTAADSVALPKAIAGSIVLLANSDAADSMNVYAKPGSGDTINGSSTSTAFAQAAGKLVSFICFTAGAWITSTASIP